MLKNLNVKLGRTVLLQFPNSQEQFWKRKTFMITFDYSSSFFNSASSSFHSRFNFLIISFVNSPWAINCSVSNFFVDCFDLSVEVAKLSNDAGLSSNDDCNFAEEVLVCCQRLNFVWNLLNVFKTLFIKTNFLLCLRGKWAPRQCSCFHQRAS